MIIVDPRNPRGIVWLASYPKSGNTWLRIFLHHLVRILAGKPLRPNDINELERSSTNEAGRIDLFEKFLRKPLAMATPADIARIRPEAQMEMMREGKGIVLAKTHNMMGTAGRQPIINRAASAGAIYIVRNPLDVAISLADHLGISIDNTIRTMGFEDYFIPSTPGLAYEAWGGWSQNVKSWTAEPSPAVLVLRYEDLLADPIAAFAGVAAHLHLGATPAQISEAVELSAFKRLQREETRSGFVERSEKASRFFREGRAGQWRETLTPAQIDRVVAEHGDQMRRFGYLPH